MSKEAVASYKEYGAQAVFNVGIYLTYYDGKAFYTAEPDANKRLVTKMVGPEEIAKYKAVVDNIHAQGIRAIGTMTPMWEIQVLNDHPDWQHLSSPDAQSRDAMQGYPPPMGSWMSPFGDWYIEKNIKMVKTWGWDGQCIDGFGFATLDYNPYNRKAYKEFCGAEVPPKDDPNDPNYRRYLHWRMEQWGRYVHKWEGALKKVNKDFAFIPWSTGPGRWWHWTALPRIEGSELGNLMVDAPVVEIFWDFPPDQGSNLLPAFTARFYRGFCEERPVWMHAYFRSQGQQQAVTPRVESEFRLYTMLTNGAAAPVAVWMSDKNTPVKHYVDVIKAREKFLIDTKSVKWAAMLMSENSRLFYGISGTRPEFGGPFIGSGVDSKVKSDLPISQKRMPAHVESSLGVFRAAQEAHVPLDMISDRILENTEWMKQYKVLILPDAACLSDKALANIREFVKAGGRAGGHAGIVPIYRDGRKARGLRTGGSLLRQVRTDRGQHGSVAQLRSYGHAGFRGAPHHARRCDQRDHSLHRRPRGLYWLGGGRDIADRGHRAGHAADDRLGRGGRAEADRASEEPIPDRV